LARRQLIAPCFNRLSYFAELNPRAASSKENSEMKRRRPLLRDLRRNKNAHSIGYRHTPLCKNASFERKANLQGNGEYLRALGI
jgi:hypothetical protein